jgi:lipopolysaccharide/colanic/teichoic acid biosynthesis glycosyltransferase
MHVLIFYQYFATNEVAGSTRPYEIGRRMVEQGHQVTVVTGNWYYSTGEKASGSTFLWERGKVDGIAVIRVNIPFGGSRQILLRMIGFFWFVPFSFLAALSVKRCDVVVGSSTPLSIGVPAYLLGLLRTVPFVFELRDLWPDCVVEWDIVRNRILLRAAYWLEAFLYAKARLLIALTDGIRQELLKKGVPGEKLTTVTNGSNLELFRPDGPRADANMLGGIPDSAFMCMHAGSFGVANCLPLVLDTAERLIDDPSIQFVLMGSGPRKNSLMADAARRQLHNVHFLGPTSKANVPLFLRRADLGIVFFEPSALTYIFLPNKFFDNLSCGCPVILNFQGEAAEYVEPAGAGFSVPPNDIGVLESVIRRLAADRQNAKEMRACARQLAVRHFGWERKAEDFMKAMALAVRPAKDRTAGSLSDRFLKRALDIVGSLVLLVVFAIPMAVIGLLLRVQSKDPIFFRQTRPGLFGRPFTLIKFRTMTHVSGQNGELLPDGDRLTRFGTFLRKSSFDELPELFCVLKGEMSLVGPRPLLIRYLPYYRESESCRHSVKPGITGWAQVNGRNSVGWDQRLAMDAWYVKHRTLLLDLRILLKTIKAVLISDGVAVDTSKAETALDEERAVSSTCAHIGSASSRALTSENKYSC